VAGVLSISLLAMAGFFAGMLNAIAGGGSFLTFPTLVFLGVPPIAANASSAVALFPGYLSASFAFFQEIKAYDRKELMLLLFLGVLGGGGGALLLLVTPSKVFSWMVPWLMVGATCLFAFDQQIRAWAQKKKETPVFLKYLLILSVTTYGGYFNGGLGIILLALFSTIGFSKFNSVLGFSDINLMIGLKNAMSFILSMASVITFIAAGIVYWEETSFIMGMGIIGSFCGAILVKYVPEKVFRTFVIFVGIGMSALFFFV
jgi:uncharacterized membrane protein YfcA